MLLSCDDLCQTSSAGISAAKRRWGAISRQPLITAMIAAKNGFEGRKETADDFVQTMFTGIGLLVLI